MANEVSAAEAIAVFGVEETADLARYYADKIVSMRVRHGQQLQELRGMVEQLESYVAELEGKLAEEKVE